MDENYSVNDSEHFVCLNFSMCFHASVVEPQVLIHVVEAATGFADLMLVM